MEEPVEKRRTSSRIKSEPSAKRHQSESISEKAKAAEKPTKSAIAVGKEAAKAAREAAGPTLPTKVSDNRPLPVLDVAQVVKGLGDSDYQSIKESGVLAASIARSRQKWIHGGVFEKFWSKTKITKTMTEEEKKAAKGPTMNKVGGAKLTAEPHQFDIVFYAVKDPAAAPKQGQLPQGVPFMQYGLENSHSASPAPSNYHPPPSYHNQAPASAKPDYPSQPPTTPASFGYQNPPSRSVPPQPQAAPRPAPPVARVQQNAPVHNLPPPVPPTPPAPDPVIHALAQRASTDMQLKSVMKIVATGKAKQEELEYFQKHIDELTKMVREQQAEEAKKRAAATPAPAKAEPRPSNTTAPAHTFNHPPAPHPSAHGGYPAHVPSPATASRPSQHYYHQPPPPPRVKAAPLAPPLHLIVQFSENLNDRYLFPKNCILEFLPGVNSVLCSFIVICKGSDASAPAHFDPKLEYWEPVTIKLTSDMQTLGMLGRYVATADEVRSYMNGVMERYVMAEDAHLVLRLPKEKGVIEESLA